MFNIFLAKFRVSVLNDIMKRCPYCFEELIKQSPKCPHCSQFFIDPFIETDYHTVNKKKCVFCGKMILTEAKICRFCHKWLDEVDNAVRDVDMD